MSKHRHNWKPDLGDHRDYAFSLLGHQAATVPVVDLRPQCSPVVDQKDIGSCTGNALAGHLEFLELKELLAKSNGPEVFDANFDPISRLFIYYNERVIENTVGQDSGASLRIGIKTLVKWGACRESIWGYSDQLLYQKPTAQAYQEASSHKILSYYRMNTLADMKACLAAGYPFVLGITVYASFESDQVAQTGIVPMPSMTEECLGGHAVLAVGYDDTKQCLIVRNSWGADWGDKGYFYLPYVYVQNTDLANDFWTIRR